MIPNNLDANTADPTQQAEERSAAQPTVQVEGCVPGRGFRFTDGERNIILWNFLLLILAIGLTVLHLNTPR